MSKAFTKETETEEDTDDAPDQLPAGTKNYIRPQGFRKLEEELTHLRKVERPKVVEIVSWAAGNGDRSENGDYIYGKKRLREIDRRLRYLGKRHESAVVVDPALQKTRDQVFFGATVTYIDHHGAERIITIVGIDEADAEHGPKRAQPDTRPKENPKGDGGSKSGEPFLVSWVSPVARALLKARVGDTVKVRTPAGDEEIEVLAIRYGA